jgi:hypothetical protein
MLFNFLFKRKISPVSAKPEPESVPADRRTARLERRRRADRRRGNNQNYTGPSRREIIDRREQLRNRREDITESAA